MSSEDKMPLEATGKVYSPNENEGEKSGLDKARNRLIQEGYKYTTMPDFDDDSMKKKSTSKWTQREKHYICVLVITTVLIIAMASLLVWQYLENRDKNTCSTESCVQASASILSQIDTSVDPCEDFYGFVCGNWERKTTFPDSKPKYSRFSEVSEKIMTLLKEILFTEGSVYKGENSTSVTKAKAYYSMCMDTDRIKEQNTTPLLELVEELGQWSVTSDDLWNLGQWDLMDALVTNHKYEGNAMFTMGIGTDDRNSTVNMIFFQQAGLTLGDKTEYEKNSTNNDTLHTAFVAYAEETGKLMGGKTGVKDKMEAVWQFEQSLAKIFVPREQLIDPEKTYHKMSVADLQKLIGDAINIQVFLSKVFNTHIPEDEEILVYTPAYFEKLGGLIASTNKETLANYIVWNMVDDIIGYLPEAFVDAAMILNKAQMGITKPDPRWERCVSKVGQILTFVIGALYVDDVFPEKNKAEVEEVVENLRRAFIDNLPSVKWMDDETRIRAIEKALTMTKMIGYPNWILSPSELDAYYVEFNLTDGDFLKSHMAGRQFLFNRILKRRSQLPDRSEWHMSPAEVNAYYNSVTNTIVFPAGILQAPFYSPILPQSFNYGAIGMVMGHELTHGFDDAGRKYDKFGNLENWWTNKSVEGFEKNAQCLEEQYSGYTFRGAQVNGKTTLGENIADNGGTKSAYAAYNRWKKKDGNTSPSLPGLHYSPEQLFFIGFGQVWCAHYTQEYAEHSVITDVHSPSKVRVFGVIVNDKNFGDVFSCPVGSTMNPENKCEIW